MLLARDYNPAVKVGGAKWLPNDIAGMLGLPTIGNIYYVDPYAGSDTANNGGSPNTALATVAAAYALCTSGNHDVVIISPTGGTGRTTEAAAITWAKRFTHLIGSAAPTALTPRAGMTFSATGAGTTPQFNVTENGCIFSGVVFYQAVADSYQLVTISGDYNYFSNCHFAGIGNATAGDSASARCVTLTGGGENVFDNCTFGVDSVARSAANACLELGTVGNGSARNIFRGCRFICLADNAGALFVKIASEGDVDRFVLFEHCLFHNAIHSGGATAMTVGIDATANLGGTVTLWDSWFVGATAVTDAFTSFEVIGSMTQPTGASAGLSQTPS